jgi:hypothetical protein
MRQPPIEPDQPRNHTEAHGKYQKLNHKGLEGHKARPIIEPPRCQDVKNNNNNETAEKRREAGIVDQISR